MGSDAEDFKAYVYRQYRSEALSLAAIRRIGEPDFYVGQYSDMQREVCREVAREIEAAGKDEV